MRVIAGTARSMPLKTREGKDTRPTTDRIKETLFNVLQGYVQESVFFDLFSGSGGIGIEAISRGAKHAYFVENDAKAIECIVDNLKFTKFTDRATVLKQDVVSALNGISEKEVDIIFMDPPYDQFFEKRVLEVLATKNYVTDNTLIVVETSLRTDFDYLDNLGFEVEKEKRYKTNKHVFVKRRKKWKKDSKQLW